MRVRQGIGEPKRIYGADTGKGRTICPCLIPQNWKVNLELEAKETAESHQ